MGRGKPKRIFVLIKNGVEIVTIKELRKQTGMTQKQFADYFEIPYRTIQNWEGDINKCPEYLLKLMQYKIGKEFKK